VRRNTARGWLIDGLLSFNGTWRQWIYYRIYIYIYTHSHIGIYVYYDNNMYRRFKGCCTRIFGSVSLPFSVSRTLPHPISHSGLSPVKSLPPPPFNDTSHMCGARRGAIIIPRGRRFKVFLTRDLWRPCRRGERCEVLSQPALDVVIVIIIWLLRHPIMIYYYLCSRKYYSQAPPRTS